MKVNMDLTDADPTMKVAALTVFADILDEEIVELSVGASAVPPEYQIPSEDKNTELTKAQQDFLDASYQNVKQSIKETVFYVDSNTLRPIRRIVLEINLEPVRDNLDIPKEKIYEVIGRAICERGFVDYE